MKVTYKAQTIQSIDRISVNLIENIGPFCNETLVSYTVVSLLAFGFLPLYFVIPIWLSGIILAFILGTRKIKKSEGKGYLTLNCLVSQLKDGDIFSFEGKTYMIISHDKPMKEYLALQFEANKNINVSYI